MESETQESSLQLVFGPDGLPNIPRMITDWGLYDPVGPLSKDPEVGIRDWLWKWSGEDYRFDCFCLECGKDSVFFGSGSPDTKKTRSLGVAISSTARYTPPRLALGQHGRTFHCTRNAAHKVTVILLVTDAMVVKIGQHPSLADISQPHLNVYKPIIGLERVKELRKAAGLFSHGVGAGSLIYLRRTLESIVALALEDAVSSGFQLAAEFEKQRFEDRVRSLSDFLPEAFVANRKLYGVISAGVHSLDEQQCLSIFPLAIRGIEMALSEELIRREKLKRAKLFQDELAKKEVEIGKILKARD